TGRSRNDQVALDLFLWIQESIPTIRQAVTDLCRAFFDLAERSADIVMPSFTHLQRAQPISAGSEALCWADAFDRCRTRLYYIGPYHARQMPLGAGAIAGTSLPIDRKLTSEILASVIFSPPTIGWAITTNSIESTATRDSACDLLYACAMISQWL